MTNKRNIIDKIIFLKVTNLPTFLKDTISRYTRKKKKKV